MRGNERLKRQVIFKMLALVEAQLETGVRLENLHFEVSFDTWMLFDAGGSKPPRSIKGVRIHYSDDDSGDDFSLWRRL